MVNPKILILLLSISQANGMFLGRPYEYDLKMQFLEEDVNTFTLSSPESMRDGQSLLAQALEYDRKDLVALLIQKGVTFNPAP